MAAKQKGAVLITGASTGIGRTTALDLDKRGYTVFAGVRKAADADSLKKEATGDLTPLIIDVAKPATITAARKTVEKTAGAGGLKGLVNNAGIALGGPLETMPIEDFKNVQEINVNGTLAVTQAFMPLVRTAKGTVIFITSIGGLVPSPFFGAYNASKFALEGMAGALRNEVVPWGIRVVCVEPGSVKTPIWDKGNANSEASRKKIDATSEALYGPSMDRGVEVAKETGDRGIPTQDVADVIRKAIEANRPKTRYIVGRDAKMMFRFSRMLGDRRFGNVMRSQMKLPKEPPASAAAKASSASAPAAKKPATRKAAAKPAAKKPAAKRSAAAKPAARTPAARKAAAKPAAKKPAARKPAAKK